jgi:hypothetical protein
MKASSLIVAGVAAGGAGFFLGKRFLKQRKLRGFSLRGVGCSLRGLGPCRDHGSLGQAQHERSMFASLMREMGRSIQAEQCGEARRFLLKATAAAKTKKEKSSLLKAFRKLQRCEISQISQD